MKTQEKTYQIALSQIKGVGYALLDRLMMQFGSAQAIFKSTPQELAQVPEVSKHFIHAIHHDDALERAIALFHIHDKENVCLITPWEADYPERLKHIYRVPKLLYLHGNVDLNTAKIVSIVGTRSATNYGKKVVEKLLGELEAHPLLIVSGLAYGIDVHVHRTALELGFPTLAVVAGGIDVIYPTAHKDIAKAMLAQGGLLSEHPLQTPPEAYRFVTRNRIIAGLADATIVIEAGQKSGALITANYANDYNREVFAVSGDIYAAYSFGCHHLIKTHRAHLLTSAADLVEAMQWDITAPSTPIWDRLPTLTDSERNVVKAIGKREVPIDALSYETKLSSQQLSAMLLQLELKQIVKCLPGNKFRLVACP